MAHLQKGIKVHVHELVQSELTWFEGGQMPLLRRVPKFGFTNPNRVEFQIVNVSRLQELA